MSLTENKLKIEGVDVATEINAKVNSTELAKVAISGSYNDLKDKPSGGASGDYLPLSGGTITGTVNFQGSNPIDLTDADGNLQGTILVDSFGITIKPSKRGGIGGALSTSYFSFSDNGVLVNDPNYSTDGSGNILEIANVNYVHSYTKHHFLSSAGGTLTGGIDFESGSITFENSSDRKFNIESVIDRTATNSELPTLYKVAIARDSDKSECQVQLSSGGLDITEENPPVGSIRLYYDNKNKTGTVETQQPSDLDGDYEIATLKYVKDKVASVKVPTKVSDLTNDSNFVTSSSLSTVATSGSYTDLSNKPTIPTVPTKLSQFTNDMGFAKIQSSTTDLTAGSSTLATGTVYLVYE